MPSTVSDVPLTNACTVQTIAGPAVTATVTAVLPSAAPPAIETQLEPCETTSSVMQLIAEIVTQADPVVTPTVSCTPSKLATSTTFASLQSPPNSEDQSNKASWWKQESESSSIDISRVSS